MLLPFAAIDAGLFDQVLFPRIVESLGHFGPETQVAVWAMAIFLLDVFIPKALSRHLAWLAIAGCVFPALSLLPGGEAVRSQSLFFGMTAVDGFANFFKLFFLAGTVPVVILAYLSRELEGHRMGEFYGILLSAVLGAMLMASANHFLMAFLSLELLSISSYVLVGFFRGSRKSSEAALKYVIYGSVAAGVMGLGLSLLYGMTGSGDIRSLARAFEGVDLAAASLTQTRVAVMLAMLLTFAGLAYKMATIPMHFWCPDVYEGAPTSITAFLSVVSKAAGFALTFRFLDALHLVDLGGKLEGAVGWPLVMLVVSIFTMTLGNFAALWQENLKRMMAYSSIAHAGYMMMGLAVVHNPGLPGASLVAYYLLAYLAMNLGVFAVIILVENQTGSVDVKAYAGLGRRAPFLAVAMTLFLFSLIGIPPTAGFGGKLVLFQGVLKAAGSPEAGAGGWPYYLLAVAAVLNTAVSVYYYARIIKNMFLLEPAAGAGSPGAAPAAWRFPALGTALVAVLLFLTFYLFFCMGDITDHTLRLEIFS